MVSNLEMDELAALRTCLPGHLTVATICSGTDVVIHALRDVQGALSKTLGVPFNVSFLFGCEKNPLVRSWALANAAIQPQHYFGDAEHLGQSNVAWDCACCTNT